MKIDPAVASRFCRKRACADVIQRPAGVNLTPAWWQKIADGVTVFQGMTHDCLMSTWLWPKHMPHKAGSGFKRKRYRQSFSTC